VSERDARLVPIAAILHALSMSSSAGRVRDRGHPLAVDDFVPC